jgi:chromodomain-helicase-DNA-binding protein 4
LKALREKSRLTGFQLLPENSIETLTGRKRRNHGELIQDEDIDDVVWCYVKWGELDYAEGIVFLSNDYTVCSCAGVAATWDTPPARGEPGWDEFESAFSRYVQSQAVFVAKVSDKELDKRDDRDPTKFAQNRMEVKTSFATDPKCQLRPFQVEGINWLTFQWWRKHPAILADEMGLVRLLLCFERG